jgi:hypothetical protein
MKTVFKVGMVVYDQLNFPDKEGKVVDICKDERVTSPITVIFKDRYDGEIERYYTLDGRYKTGELTVLSTKPYQIILQGFEQKAPAPTYEEALKEAHRKGDYYYLPDSLEVPSEELVDATIALLKLLFLRDYYNDDWQPDLKNKEQRGISVILDSEGNFFVWGVLKETETHALVFKDEKVAKRFIEEQRELLEIAKPLL